jgi:hypothetical protein
MKLSISYSQQANDVCLNSLTMRVGIQYREDKSLSDKGLIQKQKKMINSISSSVNPQYTNIPQLGVKEYLVSTFSGTLREVRAGFKRPEAQGFSNNYEYPQKKDHTLWTIISQNPLVYSHFAPVLAVKGSLSKDKLKDFQEHGIHDVVGIKWFYIDDIDTPWNEIFQAICEQCMDSSVTIFPEVEEPVDDYYIPTEDEIEEIVEDVLQEEEEEVVPKTKRHKYELIEDDNSDLFEDIPMTDEEIQRFYEQ